MIIDSHAHYNNSTYKNLFRYLSYDKYGYTFKEGELLQLMYEIEEANIHYFIEPGVGLQFCTKASQKSEEHFIDSHSSYKKDCRSKMYILFFS